MSDKGITFYNISDCMALMDELYLTLRKRNSDVDERKRLVCPKNNTLPKLSFTAFDTLLLDARKNEANLNLTVKVDSYIFDRLKLIFYGVQTLLGIVFFY